jgi:hypothetical protein
MADPVALDPHDAMAAAAKAKATNQAASNDATTVQPATTVDPVVEQMANWASSKYGTTTGGTITPADLAKAPGAQNMTTQQLQAAADRASFQAHATANNTSNFAKGIQQPLATPGAMVLGKQSLTDNGKFIDYGNSAGTSYDTRRLGLGKEVPPEWINTTATNIPEKSNIPASASGMPSGVSNKITESTPTNDLYRPSGSNPSDPLNGTLNLSERTSPKDLGAKVEQAANTLDKKDWGAFLGKLAFGLMDAYGVSRSAYGGVQRKTMAQQEFANELQIKQQKEAYKNRAEADISKMEPQAQQNIRQIQAEYAASGDKEVFVSKMNYLRNKGLIDEQQYTNLLKAAVGPEFIAGGTTSGATGGINAANNDLMAPGSAKP